MVNGINNSREQQKPYSRPVVNSQLSREARNIRVRFGKIALVLLLAGIALPFLNVFYDWNHVVGTISSFLIRLSLIAGIIWIFVPVLYVRSDIFRTWWREVKTKAAAHNLPQLAKSWVIPAGLLAVILVLVQFTSVLYDRSADLTQRLAAAEEQIQLIEGKLGGTEKLGCSEQKSINKVMQSVVRIVGGESEGSGFAIQTGGMVLTNFHVIEFEPNPKVVLPDNTFSTAKVVMADKNADLAIIEIDKELPIIAWGNPQELNPAEALFAIGYPLGGQLTGEASVSRGSLSGKRRSKDVGIEYIQTDITLNHGLSGGPMINICGEIVGVNTAGLAGLGLAISSDSVKQKWLEMSAAEDPLRDVQTIRFAPDESPLEAVRAFYNYLKARQLEKAFDLLSDNFKEGHGIDYWKQGYETLLDTTVVKIEEDGERENRINVKLTTKDFVDGEIVYKYFEGYWDVRDVEGRWLLWDPEIKEVEDPDYWWWID